VIGGVHGSGRAGLGDRGLDAIQLRHARHLEVVGQADPRALRRRRHHAQSLQLDVIDAVEVVDVK